MCEKCAPGGPNRDESEELYDGYGIYLTRVCPACREEAMSHYRSDIFEQYETDEQIEPELRSRKSHPKAR